jgi:hypothetical protein
MSCPRPAGGPAEHDDLRLGLMRAGIRLRDAVADPTEFGEARAELVAFCVERVLPHLQHDERWLARAEDCAPGGLLAEAMRTESRAITAAVFEVESAEEPCEAVGATRVLHTLLALHADQEEHLASAISLDGRPA